MHSSAAIMAAVLALAGPPEATSDSGGVALIRHCVVSLIEETQISAPVEGILLSINVQQGDVVEKDQLLAQIDDRDVQVRKKAAELELKAAEAEAANKVDIHAAEKASEVAQAEYDESLFITKQRPGAIPQQQLRRERLTRDRSILQIEVANHDFAVAQLTAQVRSAQVEVAQQEIDRRQIKSFIAGQVEERFKHAGEWVTAGEPIVHIVQMDRLRIEGFMPADEFTRGEVLDRPVVITVELKKGEQATFTGRIGFVSQVAEGGGEYRVFADVDNRKSPRGYWMLHPGLNAEMAIQLAK